MAQYRCSECGELHDESKLELSFRRPDPWLQTTWWQRLRWRARINDDLCNLGGRARFMYGLVELPLLGREAPHRIGMWAEVERDAFERYVDFYNGDTPPPFAGPLTGRLANSIPKLYTQSTVGLPVTIRPTDNGRPRFTIVGSEHPLALEQARGITPHRAHEIVGLAIR